MILKKMLLLSICLTLFIDAVGEGILYSVIPEIFKSSETGFTVNYYLPREILCSLAFALFPFACMIGMPLLGSLSDKYSRHKVIIYGLSGLTANYLMGAIAISIHNIWLFLLSILFSGLFSGTYAVGSALISDLSQNDNEKISLFRLPTLASILGFILGPSLFIFSSCILKFTNALATPFIFAFILGIVNLILLAFIFKYKKNNINDISHYKKKSITLTSTKIFKKKHIFFNNLISESVLTNFFYMIHNYHIRILVYTYLMFELGYGLYFQSLSSQLSFYYHYKPSKIGLFFVAMSLLKIVSMYGIQPYLTRYIDYKNQMKLGLKIITMLLLISFTNNMLIHSYELILFGFWITAIFYSLANPLITLGFTLLISNSVGPQDQGKIMGMRWQIWSFAWFVSGLLMGPLINNYSFIPLFSAFFFTGSYIILKRYLERTQKQ